MAAKTFNEVPTFADFRMVIKEWPSRAAMAGDLEQEHWLVEAWHRKNSIPPRWFDAIVRSAIKRDLRGITLEVLLHLHMARVEQGPPKALRSKKNETVEADA